MRNELVTVGSRKERVATFGFRRHSLTGKGQQPRDTRQTDRDEHSDRVLARDLRESRAQSKKGQPPREQGPEAPPAPYLLSAAWSRVRRRSSCQQGECQLTHPGHAEPGPWVVVSEIQRGGGSGVYPEERGRRGPQLFPDTGGKKARATCF